MLRLLDVVQRLELGRADLVGPQQGLQDEQSVAGAQRRQPGALTKGEVHQRRPVALFEGRGEQAVGLRRRRIGFEIVGLLEQDRIDLLGGHELQHRDLVLLGGGELVEILVGEHHPLAVLGVVRLVDVLVGDDLTALGAHALIFDPPAVLRVHLVEGDVVRLGGRIHLHRDVDEAERE